MDKDFVDALVDAKDDNICDLCEGRLCVQVDNKILQSSEFFQVDNVAYTEMERCKEMVLLTLKRTVQ